MKGIVFTEFLEMVEKRYGMDMVDRVIDPQLESGGAYTSIGVYSHDEFSVLVDRLHHQTQISTQSIFYEFGRHLMCQFADSDRETFSQFPSAFDFVEQIESYFRQILHRLHPEIEVPKFLTRRLNEEAMEVKYQSFRKLGHFAEGLIQGVFDFYHEPVSIQGTPISPNGDTVMFTIRMTA